MSRMEEEKKRYKKILGIAFLIFILFVGLIAVIVIKTHKKPVKQPIVEDVIEEPVQEEVERTIKVSSFEGNVALTDPSTNAAKPVNSGASVSSEDIIKVDSGSVDLLVDTDKHISASANTIVIIKVDGSEARGRLNVTLEEGSILCVLDNPLGAGCAFEVETPNSLCSVRGTEFRVTYNKETNVTDVEAIVGKIEVMGKEDGMAYIAPEGMVMSIPYEEYGYFDDNVPPVFFVDFPQYAFYKKGNQDSSYPTAKFDPLYGIRAEDANDGDCTENITYEMTEEENGIVRYRYTVADKVGNTDSFTIACSMEGFLETEGDLFTEKDVQITYAMQDSE